MNSLNVIYKKVPTANSKSSVKNNDQNFLSLPPVGKRNRIELKINANKSDVSDKRTPPKSLPGDRSEIDHSENSKAAEIFKRIAHDINSPLAVLNIIVAHSDELPQVKRDLLNRALVRISNILKTFPVGANINSGA